MTETRQTIEIRLEQLGERSWLTAMANTLTGAYGSAQVRFVGRVSGAVDESDDVYGATFPVMRLQSMDDQHEPNAWIDLAKDRLDELDQQLRAAGWLPQPARGEHWWSLRYARGDAGATAGETAAEAGQPSRQEVR